jgi:PEGA domain
VEIEPRAGQLYVDGFYAGTAETIAANTAGLRVSGGWHRIEIRAPGYETLASNVTIVPGQSSTFRAALKPLQR